MPPRGTVTEPHIDRWLTVKEARRTGRMFYTAQAIKASKPDSSVMGGAWKHSIYQKLSYELGVEARRKVEWRGKGQVWGYT